MNYADYKSGLYGTDSTVYTRFRLRASSDGAQWTTVADLSRERRDRPNAYVELSAPTRARFVRYEHVHVGAANLAISDIRVFGNGVGSATRDARAGSPRAAIATSATPSSPGSRCPASSATTCAGESRRSKLYQTYQRFADQGTTLELRALTVGQAYWVAIESFDENGVSTLSSCSTDSLARDRAARVNLAELRT